MNPNLKTRLLKYSSFELRLLCRHYQCEYGLQFNKTCLIQKLLAKFEPCTLLNTEELAYEFDSIIGGKRHVDNVLRFVHSDPTCKIQSSQAEFTQTEVEPIQAASELPLSKLQTLMTTDANSENIDNFPPTININTIEQVYRKTLQDINPSNFKPTGVCCCCAMEFPCVLKPNITILEPISTTELVPKGILRKLTWRNYSSAPSTLLKMDDYFGDEVLNGLVLERKGIIPPTSNDPCCKLVFCSQCFKQLHDSAKQMPQLALANNLFTGSYSEFGLPSLTWMESQVIAKFRTTSSILKLRRQTKYSSLGICGHLIAFPQKPETIFELTSLPLPLEEIPSVVHILLVQQKRSSSESSLLPTLEAAGNILKVNRQKIYMWLSFLKQFNPCYENVSINQTSLNSYPLKDTVPDCLKTSTTIIDDNQSMDEVAETGLAQTKCDQNYLTPFSSENELQQSFLFEEVGQTVALKDLYESLQSTITLKRKPDTDKTIAMISGTQYADTRNPNFYPGLFPTLYPLGIGGPTSPRSIAIPLKLYAKHSLIIHSSNFRKNSLYKFFIYDELRRIELFSCLKVKLQSFNELTLKKLTNISLEQIENAFHMKARGEFVPKDHPAFPLMNAIRLTGSQMKLSQYNKTGCTTEIKSTIVQYGSPSLYITITPNDQKHILSYCLANKTYDFNMDNLPFSLTNDEFRLKLASENPVDMSVFFHVIIREILGTLFGFNLEDQTGIFGPVNSYYGMVEAQNRGTLHIHMLIWLKNSPDPDTLYAKLATNDHFKDRLFTYLDSIIHQDLSRLPNQLPPIKTQVSNLPLLPHNSLHSADYYARLHKLIKEFQIHEHCATCFSNKHTNGQCRMRMPAKLFDAPSFDQDTGEIHQRRLHPMINNFNPYLTLITQSNTDIQFLLKAKSCLSVIHYITNYISKGSDKIDNYFAIMRAAKKSLTLHPIQTCIPGLSDIQHKARALLLRIHNLIRKATQICENIVCTLLLDLPMEYKHDEYEYLPISSLIQNLLQQQTGQQPKNNNSSIAEDEELHLECLPTSFQSIHLSRFGQKLYPTSLDYVYRPKSLDKLPLYFFKRYLKKVQKKIADFHFLPNHPQHNSHGLQVRTKCIIPNFAYTIPSSKSDDDEKKQIYKICIFLLFCPWRHPALEFSHFCLDTFIANDCTQLSQKYIRNIDLLSTSKEEAQRLAILRSQATDTDTVLPTTPSFDFNDYDAELAATLDSDIVNMNNSPMDWQHQFSIDELHHLSFDELKPILDPFTLQAVEPLLKANQSILNVPQHNDNEQSADAENPTKTKTTLFPTPSAWASELKILATTTEFLNELVPNPTNCTTTASLPPATTSLSDLSSYTWTNPSQQLMDQMVLESIQSSTQNSSHGNNNNYSDEIDPILQSFSLNMEQTIATKLVATKLLQQLCTTPSNPYTSFKIKGRPSVDLTNPLLLFITGEGGTGKSHVISSIKHIFSHYNMDNALFCMAPTGVAAFNIGASTIHSAFGFSVDSDKRLKMTTEYKDIMTSKFANVSFILIDEISMLDDTLFSHMNEVLQIIKSCKEPFGGLSVIVIGDFCQLSPVSGTPIYSDKSFAKELWHLFKKVIILKEQVRACKDPDFQQLLSRARSHTMTLADYYLLSTRLLENNISTFNSNPTDWLLAPVLVVRRKAAKHINLARIRSHCSISNTPEFVFPSIDTIDGLSISNPNIKEVLNDMEDNGLIKPKLSRTIHLAIGARIVLTENLKTEIGLVNGASGIVSSILLTPGTTTHKSDSAPNCIFLSKPPVVLFKPDLPHPSLSKYHFTGLEDFDEGLVPIYLHTTSFKAHYHNGKSGTLRISRKQLPIQLAYALTDYKCQGKTFEKAIIDLRSPDKGSRDSNSVYVMLSRLKTLNGLLILSPFTFAHLQTPFHAQLQRELERLALLDLTRNIIST